MTQKYCRWLCRVDRSIEMAIKSIGTNLKNRENCVEPQNANQQDSKHSELAKNQTLLSIKPKPNQNQNVNSFPSLLRTTKEPRKVIK